MTLPHFDQINAGFQVDTCSTTKREKHFGEGREGGKCKNNALKKKCSLKRMWYFARVLLLKDFMYTL